jgi:hypothetical protein
MDRSRRWQAVGLCALALSGLTATAGALASSPPDVPAGALAGREFVALSLAEDGWPRRLVPDVEVTLGFGWDGRTFTVRTGCAPTGGPFHLRDGRLRIDRPEGLPLLTPVPTRRCDEARTAQGRLLAQFFAADPRLRLNGSALVLSVEGFRLVLYERAAA